MASGRRNVEIKKEIRVGPQKLDKNIIFKAVLESDGNEKSNRKTLARV